MAVKAAANLKTQFLSTDPANHNTDLVDSVLSATNLPAASASASGVVELATTAEAVTGTDTTRALTAAGLRAVMGKIKAISFDGVAAPGACTATGAVVGDKVLANDYVAILLAVA